MRKLHNEGLYTLSLRECNIHGAILLKSQAEVRMYYLTINFQFHFLPWGEGNEIVQGHDIALGRSAIISKKARQPDTKRSGFKFCMGLPQQQAVLRDPHYTKGTMHPNYRAMPALCDSAKQCPIFTKHGEKLALQQRESQ